MTTPTAPSSNSAATLAQQLVAFGDKLIAMHIPYVWGGTTTKGFDCSGFVQFVYRHFGFKLPRTSEEQAHVGTSVPRSALQPGDLLFYDITHANSHVAMYAGNGEQIVARHTGTFLQRQKVGNFSHAQRIIGTVPGGTVGGVGATPASNLSNPLGISIPTPGDVWKAIGDSLGVPDMKDALQRLGLILFGAGLVLFGVKMLASGVINKAMSGGSGEAETAAPEKSDEEKANGTFQRKGNRRIAKNRQREIDSNSVYEMSEREIHSAANA